MVKSDTITKLSPALLRAQRKIGSALKDAKNPFFRSNYATLGAVMEACKEHLNTEGISVLQPVMSDETGQYVETILLHESGEFLSSKMRLLLGKEDMQAYGSAVSYARRYGLQSMVFIPAEDDDGEAAMTRKSSPKAIPVSEKTVPVEVSGAASYDVKNNTSAVVPTTLTTEEKPKRSSFRKPKAVETTIPSPDNGNGWE